MPDKVMLPKSRALTSLINRFLTLVTLTAAPKLFELSNVASNPPVVMFTTPFNVNTPVSATSPTEDKVVLPVTVVKPKVSVADVVRLKLPVTLPEKVNACTLRKLTLAAETDTAPCN